jgi:Tetratricopeptide repeat
MRSEILQPGNAHEKGWSIYVVKIEEQLLVEDHPDRLASQHKLASVLWSSGAQRAALAIMIRVVELQSYVLDNNHPDRKLSEAWLFLADPLLYVLNW